MTEAAEAPTSPVTEENESSPEPDTKGYQRFRLIPGEEVHLALSPSWFAFAPRYLSALFVLGVHLFFWWGKSGGGFAGEDASFILRVLENAILLGNAWTFMIIMLTYAWFNRMMNFSTSTGWYTGLLIAIAVLPSLTRIDGIISLVSEQDGLIPETFITDFDGSGSAFLWSGLMWTLIIIGLTEWYRNSFRYAVTSDALIMTQKFMLARNRRRILYENINEVLLEKSWIGTLVGFGTILPMTASGLGVTTESAGAGAGAVVGSLAQPSDDDSEAEQKAKSVLQRIAGLITYQRTVTRADHDPRNCLFGIIGYDEALTKVNELHKMNSQSGQLAEVADLLRKQQEQAS